MGNKTSCDAWVSRPHLAAAPEAGSASSGSCTRPEVRGQQGRITSASQMQFVSTGGRREMLATGLIDNYLLAHRRGTLAGTMQTGRGAHASGVPCLASRQTPVSLRFSRTQRCEKSPEQRVVAETATTARETRALPFQRARSCLAERLDGTEDSTRTGQSSRFGSGLL